VLNELLGLALGRSGCRAGQRGDAPRIACLFLARWIVHCDVGPLGTSFFVERPYRHSVKPPPSLGQVSCLYSESDPQLRLHWRELDRRFAVVLLTPQKYFPRCGLGFHALRKIGAVSCSYGNHLSAVPVMNQPLPQWPK
jgi:hypothetical protein